jgi:hypothetical protein
MGQKKKTRCEGGKNEKRERQPFYCHWFSLFGSLFFSIIQVQALREIRFDGHSPSFESESPVFLFCEENTSSACS